jgi:hypothetical protein
MSPGWPIEMLSTFLFEDVGEGRTKLTVTWVPINATDEEHDTFDKGRLSMTGGWTGTLDKLDVYLADLKNQGPKV